MTLPDTFSQNLATWKSWQSEPWGRLFYRVEQANLLRHLDPSPLRILDVGGGNGIDATFLAGLGHNVTRVDYTAAMLDDARAGAAANGVLDRVTFVRAAVSIWGSSAVRDGPSAIAGIPGAGRLARETSG